MHPLSPEAEAYIFSNGVLPNRQANMVDFLVQSCEQPFTTPNINKAIIHFRQVPTEPRVRYLLAKADARALQPFLGHGLRDFLHSGYTLLGEGMELGAVVNATLDYHQNGNKSGLEYTLSERKVKGFFSTTEKRAPLFDRDAYKQELDDPITRKRIPVSALLERIREYVQYQPSVYRYAPYTPDAGLNEKLEALAKSSAQNGIIGDLIGHTNDVLDAKIKSQTFGIDPDLINAMEWMDMKVGSYLYHLSFENQGLAFREQWFEKVLKYQELTGSAHEFDQQDFDSRMIKVKSLLPKKAADLVRNMTRERQARLREMYGSEVDYLHMIYINVAGMVDLALMVPLTERMAETQAGERSRKYYAGSVYQGGYGYYHSGD